MQMWLPTGTSILDVVPVEEYSRNPGSYLPKSTAIDFGQDIVLPVINESDKGPGVVFRPSCPFVKVQIPDGQDCSIYSKSNVIDFTNSRNMEEFMQKQSLLHQLEKDVLSSPDNIFSPVVEVDDSPAMQLLKEAVSQKHIDLDKYEPRFGSNYANDKRLFNKNTISMPMLVRLCNALDIKATLTLEDREGDIANPMGTTMSVEITEQGGDINERKTT